MMRELVLGIPFFQNAHLVNPLIRSLLASHIDQSKHPTSLVLVMDSPGDNELVTALQQALESVRGVFPAELICNETNLGFVRSANLIMEKALQRNADIVLINSDVVLFEHTLCEMLEVAASDPMIGFVSPRTNDTTICTFPLPGSNDGPAESFNRFRSIASRLPRVTYAPTAVGFCLFIKVNILRMFGCFDLLFGQGYDEENDLILRANRCGYRAVIANWAYAYHHGSVSFGTA